MVAQQNAIHVGLAWTLKILNLTHLHRHQLVVGLPNACIVSLQDNVASSSHVNIDRHVFVWRHALVLPMSLGLSCIPEEFFRLRSQVPHCSATGYSVPATACTATPSKRQLEVRHPLRAEKIGATRAFSRGVAQFCCDIPPDNPYSLNQGGGTSPLN